MNQGSIQTLLFCAGGLHLAQIPAMAVFFTQILRMGPELARLSPTNRQIVYVMATAVVMLVLGTGVVVMVGATELARGTLLAKTLVALLGAFWALRAAVQLFLYAPSWPQTAAGRISHVSLAALFCAKTGLYASALAGMMAG